MSVKVLCFTSIFPNEQEPTAGPYNFQTFRSLQRHCEVRVVSPLPWWSQLRSPDKLLRAPTAEMDGLRASYPAYWSIPKQSKLHSTLMYRSVRRYIARIRKDFPFDAILSTWACPDSVAAAHLAGEFGCPFIAKVHGSDINELTLDKDLKDQIAWAFPRAQAIIAVSEALKRKIVEIGVPEERIHVLHNAVDGALFTLKERGAVRAKLGLPEDRTYLIYVGRLGREKGVDVLLSALPKVFSIHKNLELLVVGHGAEDAALREQAESLGVANRVRFMGSRLHHEVPDWIAAGDVLCLPSRREGCPNVVLEAFASGRPVVASDVGGVPELLGPGQGELAPSEDSERLGAAILRALDREWDPARLRASAGHLSWDSVADRVFDLLGSAIETHRERPLDLQTTVR